MRPINAHRGSYLLKVTLCLGLLHSQALNAAPGFHTQNVPQVLETGWNATFALYYYKKGREVTPNGVIYVIRKERVGKRNLVQVMTAGHILENALAQLGTLGDPSIGELLALPDTLMKAGFMGFGKMKPMNSIELRERGREVAVALRYLTHAQSKSHDLATLIFETDDATFNRLAVLKFAEDCRAANAAGADVALIGFPFVGQRNGGKETWEDPGSERKRWSKGKFNGQANRQKNALGLQTSADALENNSGSPAIDRTGAVSGTLIAGVHPHNEYGGSTAEEEAEGIIKVHSVVVGCQATKDFAAKSWSSATRNIR